MKFNITNIAGIFLLALTLMITGCGDDNPTNGGDNLSISSFSPTSAMVGQEVTITGSGFSGNATVSFTDGVQASITSSTATELVVTVPSGAEDGPITVSVDGESATSSYSFTVGAQQAPVPEPYASFPGTKIAEDETWSNDTTLAGPHFVLPGVTLKIEAGVTVEFEYHNGNADDVGTIITLPADDQNFDSPRKTAKLNAIGTANDPIIFTSDRKEINAWGGIILAGRAGNNIPGGTGNIEGLEDAVQYGGNNDSDNSGTLRYARIEYAGFSIAEGSELQSLTLYSVGSETTIDHVNIYGSSDDGIEIFGGTVDIKYLVVYGADDDSFDFDQGWQGRGQFWLAVQRPGADQGFENDGCDDLSDCGGGNGPTSPTLSNITVFGAKDSDKDNMGLKLRENLEGSYNNVIVSNFMGYNWLLDGQDGGVDAGETDNDDADNTYENYGSGDLTLSNFVLQNNGGWEVTTHSQRYDQSYEMTSSSDPADLFTNPGNYDFSLPSGSPYLTGGETPDDSWFDNVDYRGAFGTNDWTREGSWVLWPI